MEGKTYEIKKNDKERILSAVESIAESVKKIANHIVSDPGDEVDHIRSSNLPDDIENIA